MDLPTAPDGPARREPVELHRRAVGRRAVLAGGGAAGCTALLAACGSAGPSAAAPSSGPASPGAPALVRLGDLPVGQSRAVGTGPGGVVVTRTGDATAVAHSARCTHRGCAVRVEGAELHCPCHGSVFDAATGAVRHGPAQDPLPEVPVRVEGGAVLRP